MTGRRRRPLARPLKREQVIRAVTVTATLAFVAFAVGVWTLVSTVLDSNDKIDALYLSATENRAKLVAVGEKPVGPPPEQILGKPGPAGRDGTDGTAGQDGQDGRAGQAGTDGRDGKDATPTQVAAAVEAYMRAHPPKSGPAGPAGRDGRDGADGLSPACMAEPDECRGAAGSAGSAGADGARGAAPSAWLWTDPATNVSYECRRSGGPDGAPLYGCAPVT